MKQQVTEWARFLGFADCAFVDVQPFQTWRLRAQAEQTGEAKTLAEDPRALMPQAQSILLLFWGYQPAQTYDGPRYVRYYIESQKAYRAAKQLAEYMRQAGLLVLHTAKLPAMAAALRTGGRYGDNGLYIHPRLGSFLHLELLLTNLLPDRRRDVYKRQITDMYSHPLPTEMDPTALMAPFFFCFFGMMVSDAGYGILLTIGALLLLKIAKPRGMMGQITAVVAMGGISTLIWGAVFGGWFGEELLPAIWFVPLEEPIMMLGFCLALGMVHLSAGILAHAWQEWKARRPLDAVCDSLFILCTLWGIPMLLLGWNVGMYICLFGLAGLLLTGGRAKKGFFGKVTGGLSSLYGLTSYLSDILSYSRLFGMVALG